MTAIRFTAGVGSGGRGGAAPRRGHRALYGVNVAVRAGLRAAATLTVNLYEAAFAG